jgi:N-methylhydantoinase A/oxoprolinase/acetone carboxylase beta subunit
MARLAFGVDIGGTFTDVVAYDARTGALHVAKVPSTPPRLADGFLSGIRRVLAEQGTAPADVERIVHGTTIGTNAVLEHRGATLGLLMTAGFEDVLAIGRQKRSDIYNLAIGPEEPLFLSPRRRIRGIPERLGSTGEVLVPLDEAAVCREATDLVERHGVTSIVVCYLFSYLDDRHERRTRELIRARYPELAVSLSSEVDARFREYERLVMTAFDAYIRPVIRGYLGELGDELGRAGIEAPFQVMQSRGAISGARAVGARPVATVLSGPAAGVIGGAHAARQAGFADALTIDVGGTSCDVALVRGGRPVITSEGRIETFPLRLPMVDVHTIGAGGGSIAVVDAAGVLKVGPRSAGSEPGPAAYGRGGTAPTVTDASVVLGYLNPDYFAGGAMRLRADLARRAIQEGVAAPLGLDLPAAAAGVHRVLNGSMAQALRLVSVRRGHDPRRVCLVALGGAGAVHAGRLAATLGAPTVVVPPTPGVLSALGLLLAGVEHERSRTLRARCDRLDPAELNAAFADLDAACAARMADEGVEAVAVAHFVELRYVRQSYELEVALPPGSLTPELLDRAVVDFHARHEQVYGFALPHRPVELVTVRAVHAAALPPVTVGAALPAGPPADPVARRTAYFEEGGAYEPTPIYRRSALVRDQAIVGPAIVEQPDTTTVVYPGQTLRVDGAGTLIVAGAAAGPTGPAAAPAARLREAIDVR